MAHSFFGIIFMRPVVRRFLEFMSELEFVIAKNQKNNIFIEESYKI